MEVIKLIAKTDESGCLNLQIPTQLATAEVNIVIVLNPVSSVEQPLVKYDFSDLVGQLTWQGDQVAMQRSLRDQWWKLPVRSECDRGAPSGKFSTDSIMTKFRLDRNFNHKQNWVSGIYWADSSWSPAFWEISSVSDIYCRVGKQVEFIDEIIASRSFAHQSYKIQMLPLIDPVLIEKIIEIRQQFRLKLPDAIIAAMAIHNLASLVTADQEFAKINFLTVIHW